MHQKGVEQINDAVSCLDKQTQENANIARVASDIAAEASSMAKKYLKMRIQKSFLVKIVLKMISQKCLKIVKKIVLQL